jgi:biopolymer transport protein ExbD
MAGGGQDEDNPVAINVTAMVDVIFCLCLFYMCSFKFKQLEGKFESWLPQGKGAQGMPLDAVIQEVRVALFWDDVKQETKRKFGTAEVPDDEDLEQRIAKAYDSFVRLGHPEVPCTIDAAKMVPWQEVVNVMNISKKAGLEKIEFAFGTISN